MLCGHMVVFLSLDGKAFDHPKYNTDKSVDLPGHVLNALRIERQYYILVDTEGFLTSSHNYEVRVLPWLVFNACQGMVISDRTLKGDSYNAS